MEPSQIGFVESGDRTTTANLIINSTGANNTGTPSVCITQSSDSVTPNTPLNIIGFPFNQLANQFVQQIPITQFSTVQGYSINPTLFTSPGSFFQTNQLPPFIMNPQQPIVTNALIGSLANTINNVTPLSIISAPLSIPSSQPQIVEINSGVSQPQTNVTNTVGDSVSAFINIPDANPSACQVLQNDTSLVIKENTNVVSLSKRVNAATSVETISTSINSTTNAAPEIENSQAQNIETQASMEGSCETADNEVNSETSVTMDCDIIAEPTAMEIDGDAKTEQEHINKDDGTSPAKNNQIENMVSETDTVHIRNDAETIDSEEICAAENLETLSIENNEQSKDNSIAIDENGEFGTNNTENMSSNSCQETIEQTDNIEFFETELARVVPPCNAFQDENEVNSEIMRRYRRTLNSKKKKTVKTSTETKEESIKKEYLSDGGDCEDACTTSKRFSMFDVGDYNEDGVPIEYNESEFIWEDYLQETGTHAVPPTAFKHVECSLHSGFVKGMKLEVPNKSGNGTYWVASVVMTCGQLLRLRYDGYEDDGTADFWCDLMTSEIHPIGWCSENNQTLQPPEAISDKVSDWKEFLMNSLTGARTAPSYLLDKTTGTTPIDQIKQGMKLEVQDLYYPGHVWLVKIIENVGGRLYLRYEGIQSGSLDFWLFYLDIRLHPVGWCKDNNYIYKPPNKLEHSENKDEDLMKSLEDALEEAKQQVLPLDVFKDQKEIVPHEFEVGMKLEALHPISRNQIYPATVTKIVDKFFFMVELDAMTRDDKKKIKFPAYSNMTTIFPVHWCQWKGIKICFPRGWDKPEFSWPEYLSDYDAIAAPESCFTLINEQDDEDHEFEKGMKLEAVNRENPNQICAATITKIVGHLMWVHLDNSMKMVASHIEDVYSHNLYPVGWCESNGYQLKPPRKTGLRSFRRVAIVEPEKPGENSIDYGGGMHSNLNQGEAESSNSCPKIYFNHKCFSGPYLSKFRIAELPRCVGPGPIILVMKEVLSMLINVAYKSCRVLRELQMEGPANPTMHQQTLKAKYKSKCYRAVVEICKMNSQLEDFCRQVCIKLECCPNLISSHFIIDQCPENCSQLTKTKYTYYYGKKKKKVGRPPLHSNNGDKKKDGKKKLFLESWKRHSPDIEDYNDDDKASVDSDTKTFDSNSTTESKPKSHLKPVKTSLRLKRKYIHHLPPPSDMRTRGEKRPRYSFERRTHKKILLPSPFMSHQKNKSSHSLSMKAGHSKHSHHKVLHHHHHHHQKKKKKDSIYPIPQCSIKKEDILKFDKNPLEWTISNVVDYIKTTDCANISRLLKEQEIDGQALLLLTLPTVQEHLGLKLGPAVKLCHHIEKVKIAFYETYAK